MSFIVKGIDLPKEGEMHLIITKNGIICGAEYPFKIKHAYPLNLEAEAIQIPKGHGDIKDIDQITKSLPKMYLGGISHMVINDAPTILKGEER